MHREEHDDLVALAPPSLHPSEGLVKGRRPFISGWVEREWEQHSEQLTPSCRCHRLGLRGAQRSTLSCLTFSVLMGRRSCGAGDEEGLQALNNPTAKKAQQ